MRPWALGVAVALVLPVLVTPPSVAAVTGLSLTVTDAGDASDASPGDGVCATGAGACTLRAALQEANALPGLDTVAFSVGTGVVTIQPGSPLPQITDPVVVDGTTQPGYSEIDGNARPVVELDGSTAGAGAHGLWVTGGGSTLTGLVIGGFGGSGVLLQGSSGTTLVNSHIGTDPAGTAANPNAFGVTIESSADNVIGVDKYGWSNIISGNGVGTVPDTGFGIRILGAASTGNAVTKNLVGEKRPGHGEVLDKLPNLGGILVEGAPANTIGGGSYGGNFVLGNTGSGILVRGSAATNNLVVGNSLGFARQTADVNTGWDIDVQGAPGNTLRDNRIDFGGASGQIRVQGLAASGNVLEGNEVEGYPGNWGSAPPEIVIQDAPDTRVGGTGPDARNFVGRGGPCLTITGAGSAGSSVVGNSLGECDVAGVLVRTDGVVVRGNTVSTSAVGVDVDADAVTVQGNQVLTSGFDTRNGPGFGSGTGILLRGDDAVVGGSGAGEGNLVSGTQGPAVRIEGDHARVRGNRIGTNAAGTEQYHATFVNQFPPYNTWHVYGNDGPGISVTGEDAVIGGATVGNACTGRCNLVSGNDGGIVTEGAGTVVVGNRIGTDVTGTSALAVEPFAGVGQPGVFFLRNVGGRVGGEALGEGNIITGARTGVSVGNARNIAIRGNWIYGNDGLGIDLLAVPGYLEGVTPNDPGDADDGSNALQNFPTLTLAVEDFGTLVEGTLDTAPGQTYDVDLFSAPACDPSGYGEGDHSRGTVQVTTDAAGHGTFSVVVPHYLGDQFVTATATDPAGNTSEFSPCQAINFAPSADAGPDQTVTLVGTTVAVQLDGSASADGDEDPITYLWTGDFLEGTTTEVAPVVTFDSVGTHLVTLRVDDGRGGTDTDTMIVTVQLRAQQTIDFPALPDRTYGDPPFTLSATASSGLPVSYSSDTPGVCTVTDATVTLRAAGDCTIRATQAGNPDYFPAPDVTRTFTVHRAGQTITFGPLADQLYGAQPFAVTATATSGLPVSITSLTTEVCTVVDGTLTVRSAGLCALEATQPGDANWDAAAPTRAELVVGYDVQRLWPTKTVIRRGSTIPVKFRLTGAGGVPVPPAVAGAITCPDVTVTFGSAPPVCAVYDVKRDLFQADLKTSASLPLGSYRVLIRVVAVAGPTTTTVASSRFTVTVVK